MAAERGNSRVGTMFGPYEIRSLLGAGGMGEVYQAFDTTRDRIVALKLLRPELATGSGFQERFRRESRIAARLQEPHVIPVHDWGEINGVLYIDMRLVAGFDVSTLIHNEGPLAPARAASIVAQVAAALDAAHAAGLVHRDVKPENVLLTSNDFAYLVDFGIAHFGGETGLTSAGSAIGSFAYMAPERFTGAPVGASADVYSLTCVLYECLTGDRPFPRGDVTQMMAAHLMWPPPRPSVARPGLNPAFDDVIARGMEKRTELRHSSAGELARAASEAASPQPLATRRFPQQWPDPGGTTYPAYAARARAPETSEIRGGFGRGQVALAVAAAAVLAAGVVGALWLILGQNRGPNVAQQSTSPATETTVQTTTERATTVPTSSTSRINTLPGTDGLGFISYPGARCDRGNEPAALARTAKSVLVVCRTGAGSYYYRGVRLSDNAGIELANAVRSSGGFDVTNPTDGTRYQIRPNALTITQPDGQVFTEPMLEYASS
jgi:serine/threonine protein kinase